MQLVNQYQILLGQDCGKMVLTVESYHLWMGFMSSVILAEAPMEHTAVQHPMELGLLLIRQQR